MKISEGLVLKFVFSLLVKIMIIIIIKIKFLSEGLAQKFVFTQLVPTTFATVSPLLFG